MSSVRYLARSSIFGFVITSFAMKTNHLCKASMRCSAHKRALSGIFDSTLFLVRRGGLSVLCARGCAAKNELCRIHNPNAKRPIVFWRGKAFNHLVAPPCNQTTMLTPTSFCYNSPFRKPIKQNNVGRPVTPPPPLCQFRQLVPTDHRSTLIAVHRQRFNLRVARGRPSLPGLLIN